ncbi:hypothetical protein BDV12DRAFT_198806 [Aspergillus spectabilis]
MQSTTPGPIRMIEIYLTPLIPSPKTTPTNPVHARWALIITPPNHQMCTVYTVTEIKTKHCHRYVKHSDAWVTLDAFCLTAKLDPVLLFKAHEIPAMLGVDVLKIANKVVSMMDVVMPWTSRFLREMEDAEFAGAGTVERYEAAMKRGSEEVELSDLLGKVKLGSKGGELSDLLGNMGLCLGSKGEDGEDEMDVDEN